MPSNYSRCPGLVSANSLTAFTGAFPALCATSRHPLKLFSQWEQLTEQVHRMHPRPSILTTWLC